MSDLIKLGHLIDYSRPWDEPGESWATVFYKLKNDDDVLWLVRDMQEKGMQDPIILGDDDYVWDGHKRIVAAMLLGMPEVPLRIATSVGLDEPLRGWPHQHPMPPAQALRTQSSAHLGMLGMFYLTVAVIMAVLTRWLVL